MRRVAIVFWAVTFAVSAQKNVDEEAVNKLPLAFSEAFTRHDGHELAKIMAADCDFVTIGALWLHGRSDFETYHRRLLNGRFKETKLRPLQIEVRFLQPDIAVVHWGWEINGDRNVDGTQRQSARYGLMTMVAERQKGEWLVVVAQNDNFISGSAPEAKGLTSPIQMPGSRTAGISK